MEKSVDSQAAKLSGKAANQQDVSVFYGKQCSVKEKDQ